MSSRTSRTDELSFPFERWFPIFGCSKASSYILSSIVEPQADPCSSLFDDLSAEEEPLVVSSPPDSPSFLRSQRSSCSNEEARCTRDGSLAFPCSVQHGRAIKASSAALRRAEWMIELTIDLSSPVLDLLTAKSYAIQTVPQAGLKGKKVTFAGGKMIGGTRSERFIFIRLPHLSL